MAVEQGNNDESQLNRFLNAIVVQESGGNYQAKGVVVKSGDRAYGKYQIMGANIPAWSKEILGKSITIEQFMASPQLQDAIAIGKLTNYYRQFGADGAAVAWYAGPGNVKNRNSTKPQYGGPSIKAYADSVVARMPQMPPTPPTSDGKSVPTGTRAPRPAVGSSAPAPTAPTGMTRPTTPAPTATQIIQGSAPLPGAGSGNNGAYRLQDYGFSAAFFGSDPELKKTVDRAVKEQWSPEKFAIELKNTKWFKTKGAAEREWIQLNTSDPQSARRQVEIRMEQIRRAQVAAGATMNGLQIHDLAVNSLKYGYSDAETEQAVAKQVIVPPGAELGGQAGANMDNLREQASAFGITLADDQIAKWVRDLALGTKTAEDFDNWTKAQAKLMYPGLSAQIDQGLTVSDVAGIYRRQYAEVLELNEQDIDITKDPTIKKALSYRDPNGKADQPGVMPLWQFEAQLKNDPRWLQTNNARDSLMGVAGDVLRNFGFKA